MPQFQTIKAVFNGGEMSPLMDGRTDSEKYATGCRLLENFIVRPYGGIFKRPGTRYGTSGADTADCVRLIPFRRSTESNFVLAFLENAIKVWTYTSGTFSLVTTLTTTYAEADIADIHFCQLNDVMFLTHKDYHPARVIRDSAGNWTFTDVPFQFAPALDPPNDAVTMTLVYDADDWVSATSYVIGDFVLYQNELYRCKTANSDVAFTLAKWDKAVYRTPWNVGQTYVAGDVAEYFGSNYFWKGVSTAATTANRPGVGADWVLIPITDYRLIASSATFDADEVGSTWLLSPGSTNRVTSESITAATGTITSAAIFIQGSYTARTNWSSGNAPINTTLQLQESLDRMNFTTIKEWYINSAQELTTSYTADAPNTGGWYRMVSIRTAATYSGTMTIEPAIGKLDIPFLIQSYVSTTQVRGIPKLAVDSLIPNEVIGTAFPVWRKGAFSVSRGYPRTVAFHDQRLWFASTETEPMRLWGSMTDDFYTFLIGSLDTSGIDVTLAATQANDIQWLASFKRTLVIGTTGEEWTADSGEQDTALSPSNIRLRRWSRYGSSNQQPVLAGDGLLWLTRDNRLREFAYVFEKDGYSAPEMTLLAEHVTNYSRVIQMSYSQSPDPIVWFVHEDGTWSGFTYDRENNVTAWHRHNTTLGASCLSLCTLYSEDTSADALIFLMSRYTDRNLGTFENFLESIDGQIMTSAMTSGNVDLSSITAAAIYPGAFYMDCWRICTIVPDGGGGTAGIITAISNECPAYCDNTVLMLGTTLPDTEYTTIASDEASFPGRAPAEYGYVGSYDIIVGLPYIARCIPNRLEVQLQTGTAQMRKWALKRISFRLRGLEGVVHGFVTPGTLGFVLSESAPALIEGNRILYEDYQGFPLIYNTKQGNITTTNANTRTIQTLPQPLNSDWGFDAMHEIYSVHSTPFVVLAEILDIEVGDISGAASS